MTKTEFAERVMAAQATLFRVSYSLLHNRHDQEDAVQEAIRIALDKLGSLREEKYFSTWLVRILINECYSIMRKSRREMPMEHILAEMPDDGDPEVMQALMQLDAKVRLPIVLHYVEGYSIREIARMLRVPENTVKSRMARGRKLARAILREEGGLLNA